MGGPPKTYNYHQTKSKLAASAGIFLFHIFGYEWEHRRGVICSMLQNLLKKSTRTVYARNTEICELSNQECVEFLDSNHRQGQLFAKVRLGLRNKDTHELVSVMTFNKLRGSMGHNKSDSAVWELSRFCNVLHTNVVGGASKLFKYFLASYSPERVVSYSDIAHTRGGLYEVLQFHKVSESSPGYVWVNFSNDTYLHRVRCQKNHLHKLFNDVTDVSNVTEKQIMVAHGYVQVFDSGVIRWEYIP